MAYNIGTIISVDGEKEFNRAMRDMRQNMKYVEAESKAVMSAFGQNEKSVESLTAQNSQLHKALAVQKSGVRDIKAAIESMVAGGLDPASNKYKQLKANLDNFTAVANTTERELRDNETALAELTQALSTSDQALAQSGQAMEDLGGEAQGLGDAAQTVADRFGITLPDGAAKALNGFKGLEGQMLASIGVYAAMAAAVVAIEKALIALTMAQAEWAKEVANASAQLNMDVGVYQQWDAVMKSVGFSMEQARGDLSQLAEKALDAANGVGEGAEMFGLLGVVVNNADGAMKTQIQLFEDVYNALLSMEDATQRNAIASALLSTTGEEAVIPMLERYGASLRDARENAAIVSEEDIEKLVSMSNAVAALDNQVNVAKTTVAAQFAPSLEAATEKGVGLVDSIQEALVSSGIVELFGYLMEIVAALSPLFEALFGTLGDGAGSALKPFVVALALIADALTIIANLVALVIESFRQLFKLLGGDGFSTAKLDQYANSLNKVFSTEGATARALTLGQMNTGASNAQGLARAQQGSPSLVSMPKGIHTEAGLAAYNRRQSEDARIADGRSMYGDIFNITIDTKNARDINEVVRMAQEARQTRRARG